MMNRKKSSTTQSTDQSRTQSSSKFYKESKPIKKKGCGCSSKKTSL